jgi:hypothetical protein
MSRLADDYEAYTLDSPRDRLAVKLDYIATGAHRFPSHKHTVNKLHGN